MLRKDIFEIFKEIRKRHINISILGNPETLDEATIKKLKDVNIGRFQMSLDGLKKTHDFFRSPGSFERTLEKIKLLNKHDINCNIMFTLFPNNAGDLIPLMNFVAQNTEASSFSFDIGCFVGEGKNLPRNFTSKDLHILFSNYLIEKEKLEKKYPIVFYEKSNLHKIIRLENSLLTPNFSSSTPVISGCSNGWMPPSILSDGTNLVCRRMPIAVGKMPEDSFEKIFLEDITLKKFRRRSFFTGCKDCDLYSICRGCPANVYSLTDDPFAKNPLCFRSEIKNKQVTNSSFFEEPPLDTTNIEEWNFICTFLRFRPNYEKLLENKDFQYIYIELAHTKTKRSEFLINPEKYLADNNYNLLEDHLSWLKYRFGEKTITNHYDIQIDPIAKEAAERIVKGIYDK